MISIVREWMKDGFNSIGSVYEWTPQTINSASLGLGYDGAGHRGKIVWCVNDSTIKQCTSIRLNLLLHLRLWSFMTDELVKIRLWGSYESAFSSLWLFSTQQLWNLCGRVTNERRWDQVFPLSNTHINVLYLCNPPASLNAFQFPTGTQQWRHNQTVLVV